MCVARPARVAFCGKYDTQLHGCSFGPGAVFRPNKPVHLRTNSVRLRGAGQRAAARARVPGGSLFTLEERALAVFAR